MIMLIAYINILHINVVNNNNFLMIYSGEESENRISEIICIGVN